MSRVSELIDLIVQGKNTEATEVLNQELLNRSYDAINDMKPQVAVDYFSSAIDMPSTGEPLETTGETQYAPDMEIHQEEPTDETD